MQAIYGRKQLGMDWKALFGSRTSKLLLTGALTVGTLVAQPYRPVVFVGTSMQPTYGDREVAIASTDVAVLRRGDVVVVDGPQGPIIKRIAYLPGDKIKYVFFGGEWMMGSEKALRMLKHPEKFPTKIETVPLGHVYVLGDNWLVSIDSRQFGVVPISNITAKLPNAKPKATG